MLMDIGQETTVTVGEAAELLDMPIEDVIQLIYDRELPATIQRGGGRMLLSARDVEEFRVRTQSEGS